MIWNISAFLLEWSNMFDFLTKPNNKNGINCIQIE